MDQLAQPSGTAKLTEPRADRIAYSAESKTVGCTVFRKFPGQSKAIFSSFRLQIKLN